MLKASELEQYNCESRPFQHDNYNYLMFLWKRCWQGGVVGLTPDHIRKGHGRPGVGFSGA
jgi:hypothetical protein